MEKGMDSCSWFNVLDNKTSSNTDFLSWMKRQQQQQQQTNPDHPFIHDDDDGGGGATAADGGGGAAAAVGPTNKSGGAYEAAAGNIYRDRVSSGGGGVENFGKILHQPLDYSPGGGMGREFPFTREQWKELERQAMIYKCMISSVPVPPHLLFPLSTNFPSAPLLPCFHGGGGGRPYSRKGDPEPGRCKRTDGKKWRCSREVAPLQKYCDRHLHRGRPRSRKPVELTNTNTTITAPNHKKTRTKSPPLALPLFKPKTHLTISPPYFNGTNRDLGVMKQPWQDPIPIEAAEMGIANQGLSDYRSSFDEDYAPLDLFSYPNFPSQEMNLAAGFMDAKSSIALSEGDLSPSLNLSMAMAVGDEQIQTTRDDDIDSMWLNPACWEPYARGGGGPLAEALQSNPASPYTSTSVSSPSGVLHRTLFSHSDGSVCNSPTGTFRLIGN